MHVELTLQQEASFADGCSASCGEKLVRRIVTEGRFGSTFLPDKIYYFTTLIVKGSLINLVTRDNVWGWREWRGL